MADPSQQPPQPGRERPAGRIIGDHLPAPPQPGGTQLPGQDFRVGQGVPPIRAGRPRRHILIQMEIICARQVPGGICHPAGLRLGQIETAIEQQRIALLQGGLQLRDGNQRSIGHAIADSRSAGPWHAPNAWTGKRGGDGGIQISGPCEGEAGMPVRRHRPLIPGAFS